MDYNQDYGGLLSVYEQVAKSKSPIEACSAAMQIFHSSVAIAGMTARDIFHVRNRNQRSLRYSTSEQSSFVDDSERKTRNIIVTSLNRYIRKLEGVRWGYNKISAFYVFLISQGLYGIIGDLYKPESLKPIIDQCLSEIESRTNTILEETKNYFIAKNISKLTAGVKSMDRLILEEYPSRSFSILEGYAGHDNEGNSLLTEEDREFLNTQRSKFQALLDNPQYTYVRDAFELSEGSYRRQINTVIQGLMASTIDPEERELITEILSRS